MPSPLVPVLLLGVLPLLYIAARIGLFRHRSARWTLGALLGGAVVWSIPFQGADLVHIKRLNLLIAASVCAILMALHLRGRLAGRSGGEPGGGRAGAATGRRADVALLAIMILAVLGWLNFFSFHGGRTWIHLHDVAHYYLGSKYYAEIGYPDLYTAMLRAEAESHGNRFMAVEARDLRTYDQVHIRKLLEASDPVKAAFTEERWDSFREDVDFFRGRLGSQYGTLLLDHGFNPTPAWALLGGWLSNLVPAGSHAGILALTLIDPLLLVSALALVAWAFGARAATLCLIHFCILFGATFGWTGGAFMRQLWLLGVVACACFLKKGRHAAAGAALALAAALRVFPLLFLLPPACKAIWAVSGRLRRDGFTSGAAWLPPGRWIRFFGAFVAVSAMLVALTATLPGGLSHWRAFHESISTHVETISPNMVGLTDALAFRPGGGMVSQEEFRGLKLRRQRIYAAQLLVLFLPLTAAAGWMSRRFTDAGCLALALPLILAGVSLASYYYVFLVVLVPLFRSRPRELALVFAAEAIPYALMLFEDREAILYIYRSLALVGLCAALFLETARRSWRDLARALAEGAPRGREPGAQGDLPPRPRSD